MVYLIESVHYDFTHRWENSSLGRLTLLSKEEIQEKQYQVMLLNIGATSHWLSHLW